MWQWVLSKRAGRRLFWVMNSVSAFAPQGTGIQGLQSAYFRVHHTPNRCFPERRQIQTRESSQELLACGKCSQIEVETKSQGIFERVPTLQARSRNEISEIDVEYLIA